MNVTGTVLEKGHFKTGMRVVVTNEEACALGGVELADDLIKDRVCTAYKDTLKDLYGTPFLSVDKHQDNSWDVTTYDIEMYFITKERLMGLLEAERELKKIKAVE